MSWSGAKEADRPTYEDGAKDEAARFLYAEINPQPRIRGLETIAQCRAWLSVAVEMDEVEKDIIAALNSRIDELRDGDREESMTAGGQEVSA